MVNKGIIDIVISGERLNPQNQPLHCELYGIKGWKHRFSKYQSSFE